ELGRELVLAHGFPWMAAEAALAAWMPASCGLGWGFSRVCTASAFGLLPGRTRLRRLLSDYPFFVWSYPIGYNRVRDGNPEDGLLCRLARWAARPARPRSNPGQDRAPGRRKRWRRQTGRPGGVRTTHRLRARLPGLLCTTRRSDHRPARRRRQAYTVRGHLLGAEAGARTIGIQ